MRTAYCFLCFYLILSHVRSEDIPEIRCVRMTGHATRYQFKFNFEIVMLGSEKYYLKTWDGKVGGAHWFYAVDAALGDRYGACSQSYSDEGGGRGGGGFGKTGGKDKPYVARRMWLNGKFVGATQDSLVKHGMHFKEEFKELKKHGSIQLPSVIVWQDTTSSMPMDVTTYEIEKVEFPENIDAAWFDAIFKTHFAEMEASYEKNTGAK